MFICTKSHGKMNNIHQQSRMGFSKCCRPLIKQCTTAKQGNELPIPANKRSKSLGHVKQKQQDQYSM